MINSNNITQQLSRRRLMQFGAGFIGTATLASVLGLELNDPQPAVAENDMTPDQVLEKLMAGNKRFLENKAVNANQSIEYLQSISEEQKPFAAILGCADSRSSLEVVFDQGFGNLFVVRNAGNVATPEETGSLEFGSLVLGAKVLMVMGHHSCGAVKAAMSGQEVPGSIESILSKITPAVSDYQGQEKDKESVKKAAQANVMLQVRKLRRSPVLSELIASNQLKIVGGYLDFTTGEVTVLS